MTKPDPRIVYADIIDLPHHQSKTHPHMSLYNRAAQFAPFAALSGYEDMIGEESRETGSQTNLEEWEMEKISQKLNLISDVIDDGHHPALSITYFVPDAKKAGGEYLTVTEQIKKIDSVRRKIILMKKEGRAGLNVEIDIDKVTDIRGDLVDYLDETM
jgi:hypothetical protein